MTAKQQLWAGVRSDVFGSTVHGRLVPPSNYTDDLVTTPFVISSSVEEFVTVTPDVSDPTDIINETGCIYLQPGAVYHWGGIKITRPVCIYGRGATIKLQGQGPIFEVTAGEGVRASDVPSTFQDIIFDGDTVVDRNATMSQSFVRHSAIWITNAWKSCVMNCSFKNFNGTALWYRDDNIYVTGPTSRLWLQQHIVIGNKFELCRFGVSNSGRSEYSLADSNVFGDCFICFNCIGGNWTQRSNNMTACKSGYFHVRRLMWYEGSNRDNPVHGAFTGNTLNHCDSGCKWPYSLTLPGGDVVTPLSGLYFDNTTITPPTFNDNVLWYSSIELRGFGLISNASNYTMSGITFMGPPNNPKSRIAVSTTGNLASKVFLFGCWGNTNVNIYNIPAANVVPSCGTVTTGNYTSQFTTARSGEPDYFGMYKEIEWFPLEEQPQRPDGDDLPPLPVPEPAEESNEIPMDNEMPMETNVRVSNIIDVKPKPPKLGTVHGMENVMLF